MLAVTWENITILARVWVLSSVVLLALCSSCSLVSLSHPKLVYVPELPLLHAFPCMAVHGLASRLICRICSGALCNGSKFRRWVRVFLNFPVTIAISEPNGISPD